MDELLAAARSVRDKEDLARFLVRLADSVSEEPDTWENDSVELLLRAWSAWLVDMDGYFMNRQESIPQSPSWQFVAEMLLAARVYE